MISKNTLNPIYGTEILCLQHLAKETDYYKQLHIWCCYMANFMEFKRKYDAIIEHIERRKSKRESTIKKK